MGLDVYVGSLTRYYAQDWETIVQQWGHEHGLPVEVRRSQPSPPDRITDPAVIRPAMIKWRSNLNQALSSQLGVELDWEEAPDAPYFTDKPGWDGYGGLVLLAAHEENPQLKPPTRVSLDSWKKDQALRVSSTKGFPTRYEHVIVPQWWLPCAFKPVFKGPSAAGAEVWFGSSIRLLDQLRALNERTYRGTAADLNVWRTQQPDGDEGPFEVEAKVGLSVFLSLAERSAAARLPMLLDY